MPEAAGTITAASNHLPFPSEIAHDALAALGPVPVTPYRDGIAATVGILRGLAGGRPARRDAAGPAGRGAEPGLGDRDLGGGAEDDDLEGLRASLDRELPSLRVALPAGGPPGGRAHEQLAGARIRPEPGRDVDRVAEGGEIELARRDPTVPTKAGPVWTPAPTRTPPATSSRIRDGAEQRLAGLDRPSRRASGRSSPG